MELRAKKGIGVIAFIVIISLTFGIIPVLSEIGVYASSENTPIAYDLKDAKVKIANKVYNGKARKPLPKVYYDGVRLVKGRDFIYTYNNNVEIGEAQVLIEGKGKYESTTTSGIFKILPKKIKQKTPKAGNDKITIKWKKNTDVTKYQIRYKRIGTKHWQFKYVSKTKDSKTIVKLKSGKKYKVQVRSFTKADGVKYFSSWSSIKTVRTK